MVKQMSLIHIKKTISDAFAPKQAFSDTLS